MPQRSRRDDDTVVTVSAAIHHPSAAPAKAPSTGLALSFLTGIAVFSLGLCGGEEPKTNALATVAPAVAPAPVPPPPSPEELRVESLRLRAIELTETIAPYDATKGSTGRALRAVVAASKKAKVDCELASHVADALSARGHKIASDRYRATLVAKVCRAPRVQRAPRAAP